METEDVTLSISANLAVRLEQLAKNRGITLTELLVDFIDRIVAEDASYLEAQARSVALMADGFDLGTRGRVESDRDELHDR